MLTKSAHKHFTGEGILPIAFQKNLNLNECTYIIFCIFGYAIRFSQLLYIPLRNLHSFLFFVQNTLMSGLYGHVFSYSMILPLHAPSTSYAFAIIIF